MSPITGALIGIGGSLLRGLLGGRRKTPTVTYDPNETLRQRQIELMEQMQKRMMQEEEENKMRFLNILPLLQTAVRSSLMGLGFTEQGADIGIRRMPFYGLMMRQAQEQADAIKANLIRRGVDPSSAEAFAQQQLFRAQQDAIAQAEALNQQRLLQNVQLLGTLLGASQFSPTLLPQLLGSTQQAWMGANQIALQQQQLRQQMDIAKQQQLQTLWNSLGSLAGLWATGAFRR